MTAHVRTSPRYYLVVRQVAAPGRGKNYYYPAEVRVMDGTQSEWHAVRGLNDGLKFRRLVCGTSHSGPRSEYGRALAEAQRVADDLNRQNEVAAFDSAQL